MLHDAPQILAAWQDLRSTLGPAPLMQSKITYYSAYIRALALSGDTQLCFEALAQLRADGLKPIARSYIPILETLVRRQDAAGLTRLFSEAEADGFEFDTPLLENAKRVFTPSLLLFSILTQKR
jgi:hypothetical protein